MFKIEDEDTWNEALALSHSQPIIIDCFAEWCGPCKRFAPTFHNMENEFPFVRFMSLDVDELAEVVLELNVRSVPTFLFVRNGSVQHQIVGAKEEMIREYLKNFN
jgi:thioredoxin 1